MFDFNAVDSPVFSREIPVGMLSAHDLSLRRGPEPLFVDVNFTVFRGNKVGLTGANGVGKSSLLAALRGELRSDSGDIERPTFLKIAHLDQEIAASSQAAIEYVLDGDSELRRILACIKDAEKLEESIELAEHHANLLSVDGYRARARAAAIMHGLGFKTADHERRVAEFSGGWRVRIGLARALCSRADLLLLDEPTNHLDLDAVIWLEQWLQEFSGTLIMISHDREFLDSIIERVLHIENRGIRAYSGNYSQFEQKRAEELALQQTLQTKQIRRVAEISAFVERFRAKASKSRQAQSRLKMLQRMERIVPAHVDSPFEFAFKQPIKTPRPLLSLEKAACGYDRKTVVSDISLTIGPLDRIALLGPNGAGKSTFTKLLAGEVEAQSGTRIPAPDLCIGYFAQQQMEQLRPESHAFWHLRTLGGSDYASGDEQRVRDHLGQFGFQGDRAFEPIHRFSGGEKARLTLALVVARRPNLLLLDEPTNHLDIDMRHALNVALQSFVGGLVLVSHDRHLIKSVADTLWLVADGNISVFDGDLDDYQQWLKLRGKKPTMSAVRKPSANLPDTLSILRREFIRIEKRIASISADRTRTETELLSSLNSGKIAECVKLKEKHARASRDIASLEARWLEVGTDIELAESGMCATDLK